MKDVTLFYWAALTTPTRNAFHKNFFGLGKDVSVKKFMLIHNFSKKKLPLQWLFQSLLEEYG